jgi:hypothetical protein
MSNEGQSYHIVPGRHDRFHVEITREKGNNAIRDDFTVFDKDASKVADNGRIISNFETRADGNLVASTRDDLRQR